MKIEIKEIDKSFGKNHVLRGISMEALDGEILCLLGPSGAGKTTLIRLITGAVKTRRRRDYHRRQKNPRPLCHEKSGFYAPERCTVRRYLRL